MARVLIIDDDPAICELLGLKVRKMGHEALASHTLADGLNVARTRECDVVFLDVMMPDGNGLDALKLIRHTRSEPEVVIITGRGSAEGAELAIKSGAWDYIQKGCSLKDMILPLTRALQYREQKLSAPPPVALKRAGIVGSSAPMQASLDQLAQAAASEANLLITGETGTGKELFARAAHDNSLRVHESFVVVDCAALPESLVESMLFGHERGAFTGADRMQEGLVRHAHGGTLFLDEVGELPLSLQKAFLRVLQERSFRPLGAKSEVESDFRLVAATNRDLEQLVQERRFRSDLLFRLRALAIQLPPLRDRAEDIHDLTVHYIAKICRRRGEPVRGFTPDFLEAMLHYPWPGNVRELANTVEQAISASGGSPTLFRLHLPEHIRVALARSSVRAGETRPRLVTTSPPIPLATGWKPDAAGHYPKLKDVLATAQDQLEERYLRELMVEADNDVPTACRLSGLSRTGLYNRLKKYGLSRQLTMT
ncbi:MAG: sigma-54 dependent transcriptional regulator [Deltaproteobacteria bacterium]|nr:sigma-54 dependent transcriptional regulator [Deltaproteobacteria bacterium]